jgi:hypothetical protein
VLLNHVCALVTPSSMIIEIAIQQFDNYVFPRIELHSKDCKSLTVDRVAKLLKWISKYHDSVTQRYPVIVIPSAQLSCMQKLSAEYIKRGVHDPLQQMIQRSLAMNDTNGVDRSKDGQFFTQLPQDISVFLNSQLSTAKACLPSQFFADVAKGCQEEVFVMVGSLMIQVETRWQDLSVEHLCSIVVDSQLLAEVVDDIFGSVTSTGTEHDLTEDLTSELTQLSVLAARFLCELRFLDLKEMYISRVGGQEWQTGTISVIDTISQLREFIVDVSEWIPGDFHQGKVLKCCFDNLIQSYVAAFLSNTMINGVCDPQKVADLLHYDFFKIVDFFCVELSEQHGHYGFYTRDCMESRLEILDFFAAILECTSPDGIQTEIEKAFRQIGFDKGVPAILHIAALRSSTQLTKEESNEWHVQIWHAGEKLKMQMVEEESYFHVPDMRNSRFLSRVQSVKRRTADEAELESSTRLIKRHLISTIVSRSKKVMRADRTLLTTWKK